VYAAIASVILVTIASVILFVSWKRRKNDVKTTSSPRPVSPVVTVSSPINPPRRVGVPSAFKSQRLIVSSNQSDTFNYIKDPLTDGSTGYFTYKGTKNMLNWPVALPLNFTHAKVFTSTGGVREEKIFEFRNPNSSDTYGKFVTTSGVSPSPSQSNFFTDRLDLGTFF
jgi:hypothetical protein